MASPKTRTRAEKEAQLVEVWRLHNRGQSAWQIGQVMGLSERMVRYDLKLLADRWRAECAAGIAAHKEAELAKVHELYLVYWDAWQKSLEDRQTTSTKKISAPMMDRAEAAIKKEQREGNPAFLAGIQWCIETRCKILGLNAPIKFRNVTELTDEELMRIAAAGPGNNPVRSDNGDPEA